MRIAVLILLSAAPAVAEDGPALLRKHCAACHNSSNRMGGLDVTSRTKLLEGGDRGQGIVAGDPAGSPLLKRVRHEVTPGMPMGQPKLPAEAIDALTAWVKAGAPMGESAEIQPPKMQKGDHWAFQKPVRPAIATRGNPIDALLAADWAKKGLKPSPPADKRLLLRRVTIDLTGLPPTPQETEAFLADRSADAYEKAVDRLLESPRYGDRWGRHWMDVWRYADWYGRRLLGDQRYSHRHIWRWRDWIIESLNSDKGYDRMIQEMIAGDELAPGDPDTLRATGYLVRSFHRFNRNVWLQDTVEHLGAGMLGVTMKCARCHDHKYDPIAQEEYYRLRAFFEPYDVRLDRMPGEPDTNDHGLARVFDASPRKGGIEPYFPPIYKDTFRLIRGDETNPDKTPLSPGTPSLFHGFNERIEPIPLKAEYRIPDLRPFVRQDLLKGAGNDIKNAETALATAERLLAEARAESTKPWEKKPEVKKTVDYSNDIANIFTLRCRQCHGGIGRTLARSGLSLNGVEAALRGGWKHGPAIIPGNSAASPLIRYVRAEGVPRMPAEGEPLTREEIEKLARWIDEMAPLDPKARLEIAERRVALARKKLETAKAALPSVDARLAAEIARYSGDTKAEDLAKAAAKAEQSFAMVQAQEMMLEAQQLLDDKKAAAAKAKLEAAGKALAQGADKYTPVFEDSPETTTGRRTALARWITSRDNPTLARVAVNQIWYRHFGKPIVQTLSNFGRNGARPNNQALLDWLAVELMESGWKMKPLHRLIVTSKAYRMISSGAGVDAANEKIDPENRYLWRMNPHRMEAEVVRDAALYLAGVLDETRGGPEVDEQEGLRSRRRSLYIRTSPENRAEFLKLFDQPDPTECYFRTESVIPQQALAVSNSTLYLEAARLLGKAMGDKYPDERAFITRTFETLLGLSPTAAELAESQRFLTEHAALLTQPDKLTRFAAKQDARVNASADPKLRARENFVHALLSHNEFVTVR